MDVIILAAGIGKRAKLNYPKQFMRLGGKPLIVHAIDLFNKVSNTEKIIITVIPGQMDFFKELISDYGFSNCICVEGGSTRQESVYNALQVCSSERVIIHEAVRPFVTLEFLKKLKEKEGEAVVPCVPVTSTVFYKEDFLDRDKVLCVQLPQIFNTGLIKKAHELGKGKNYTDDSSLLLHELGIDPVIVDGLDQNIKITTPQDIKIAEVIYNESCCNNWW
ncbi:IspD/TarI family cytidylyltransferase [Anaerovorax odorimutans]|uniref:IspD/TarI family cytidylyltransferase n=1 Tax=Anaerovorax odorimutans TaxID=109327 RepID=UPI00041A8B40|nr:IspD/TarI family cytidylyltransferase [Anaerovorax odorimutans]